MAPRDILTYFILTSCLVAGTTKYVLKGTKVRLTPNIRGQPDDILWKRNGNKVVDFNGKEETVYSRYVNRITLDWVSAEVNITDLRFEDSGEYELEVYINKALSRLYFLVEVIDKVAKPTISCEMDDGSSSDASAIKATLVCTAGPGQHHSSLMKFEWTSDGRVQPGANLTIPLGGNHDDQVYSCSVRNPLTRENTTFTAKDCYPEDHSVLIACICVCILLLIILGLVLLYMLRNKVACFAKRKTDDVEKQSPRGPAKGDKMHQGGERKALLDRASTRRSSQQLGDLAQRCVNARQSLKKVDKAENGALLKDEEVSQCDPSDPEKAARPEPASVPGDLSEDTPPDVVSPAAAEQTGDEMHQGGERKALLDRASTRRSSQQLGDLAQFYVNAKQNLKKVEKAENGALLKDEEVSQCDPSDPEKAAEPEPASVPGDLSEDTPPDVVSPAAAEQTGDKMHQSGERKALLDRASTRRSSQPLGDLAQIFVNAKQNLKKVDKAENGALLKDKEVSQCDPSDSEQAAEPEPASVPGDLSEDTPPDVVSPAAAEQTENGALLTDKEVSQCDPSDSEQAAEPEPASVPGDLSEDTPPDAVSLAAAEQTECEKKADEDEDAKPLPVNGVPKALTDTTDEIKQEKNSDEVNEETADKNLRESDSSGIRHPANESEDSSGETQSTSVPEQEASQITVQGQDSPSSREETHTQEDKQQETDEPVAADEDESESVGDKEEIDLYLDSSQQQQEEDNTGHESDKSKVQQDRSMGEGEGEGEVKGEGEGEGKAEGEGKGKGEGEGEGEVKGEGKWEGEVKGEGKGEGEGEGNGKGEGEGEVKGETKGEGEVKGEGEGEGKEKVKEREKEREKEKAR